MLVALICGVVLAVFWSVAQAASEASPVALADVRPTPREIHAREGVVSVPARVALVATAAVEPSTVALVHRSLRDSGATVVRRAKAGDAEDLTVVVGRDARAATGLHVTNAKALPSGGYVLAAGRIGRRQVVLLDGADAAGAYYGAQTLGQILDGRRSISSFEIRDWPSFPRRGVVEGFYGAWWTPQTTLAVLDFMGRHKLNLFQYRPMDETWIRARWRDPIPPSAAAKIRAFVRRAESNHVTFNVGISAGETICYSSPPDLAAIEARLTALWHIGVRSFTVAFDDINAAYPGCAADGTAFGTGGGGLARAQAHVLNRIDDAFIHTHRGAGPLLAVPSEYSGASSSPYKMALRGSLQRDIIVQWTGPYTISESISGPAAKSAKAVYGHDMVIWDNYFVNDYLPGTLVLGPYVERDALLSRHAVGIVSDPPNQSEPAKLGLSMLADYAWNDSAYDPERSWLASLRELAGSNDATLINALKTFASVSARPAAGNRQAPHDLQQAMDAFWKDGDAEAPALRARLAKLRDAPAVIRTRMRNPVFIVEVKVWLDITELWAGAAVDALDALVAHRAGQPERDTTLQASAREKRQQALFLTVPGVIPPASLQIAGNIIESFVHYALRGYGP